MSTWNMPPGVNTNMIPGNRPEDMEEEAFWIKLDEDFDKWCKAQKKPKFAEAIQYIANSDDLAEAFQYYVEMARDMGYDKGSKDAYYEEQMAQSAFDEEVDRRWSIWLEQHPRASARMGMNAYRAIRTELNSD